MDNELDGRLGRLEAALSEMREVLLVQTEQQRQTLELVRLLVGLLVKPDPEGPPVHVLLAQLVRGIEAGNRLAAQTLSVVEGLAGGDGRPVP